MSTALAPRFVREHLRTRLTLVLLIAIPVFFVLIFASVLGEFSAALGGSMASRAARRSAPAGPPRSCPGRWPSFSSSPRAALIGASRSPDWAPVAWRSPASRGRWPLAIVVSTVAYLTLCCVPASRTRSTRPWRSWPSPRSTPGSGR